METVKVKPRKAPIFATVDSELGELKSLRGDFGPVRALDGWAPLLSAWGVAAEARGPRETAAVGRGSYGAGAGS